MRGPIGRGILAPNLRFRVQHWLIESPAWAPREPLRIGILSDLHWGFRPVTPRMVTQAKRRLSAVSPDLVLFLGDLADGLSTAAREANVAHGAASLAGLSAPLGTYSVLGNHDWNDDAEAWRRPDGPVAAMAYLDEVGFPVLHNTALRPQGADFWLAGLGSQRAFQGPRGPSRGLGTHDLAATLDAAPGDDPIILMAHEPDIFAELTDDRVVLTLSGHMHAGQIRPFGRALYAPSAYGTRYDYGHFRDGARNLIVSGGLGCSTIPFRIGIVPEITLVELRGP